MADLPTLSGVLSDVNRNPVVGAIITVTPVPPFSVSDGRNVAASKTVTTDAQGAWSLALYPSPTDEPSYRITATKNGEVLLSKKFHMPHVDAGLYKPPENLDNTYTITPSVDAMSTIVPLPTVTRPPLTDTDLVGATTGDGWGAWTDIISDDNTTDGQTFDEIFGELSFDPLWTGGPNANGEVEVKVDHLDDQHNLVASVLPHLNRHLPVISGVPETFSISIAAAALLEPNHHLVVRARAKRQNNRAGTVKVVAAQSGLSVVTRKQHNLQYIVSVAGGGAVRTDGTTISGDSITNPLAVITPFTTSLHNKLDGIEPNATADQTWDDIVARARASATKLPASIISGLPTSATPTLSLIHI